MRDQTEIVVHDAPTAPLLTGAATRAPAVFWTRTVRGFIIATIAAPLLAMLGALGTDALPFWPRLGYWLILMESGAMIGLGVSLGLEYWGRLVQWPWLHMAATAFLIALPLTLVVVGTTSIFFRTPPPGALELLLFLGVVFTISFVITALNYLLRLPGEARAAQIVPQRSFTGIGQNVPAPALSIDIFPHAPAAIAPATHSSAARFADRLPPAMRTQKLVALEAEDHYLRVHTPAGSTLILMRLSDAIAELKGDAISQAGAQTHRSWWVATDAVAASKRNDGRATLTLTNGVEAPVSRSFYKNLTDAGWFR
jgi:DNA-binding LytR/AlgR family response regulator